MGQKPSQLTNKASHSLSLQWISKNQKATLNPNPEQPIKFQYKTKRKIQQNEKNKKGNVTDNNYLIKKQVNNIQLTCNNNNNSTNNNNNNNNNNTISVRTMNEINKTKRNVLNNIKLNNCQEIKCKIIKTENNNNNNKPSRTKSEPNLIIAERKEKYKHRHRKSARLKYDKNDEDEYMMQQFGYEIQNIDDFLTNVSNIYIIFFARLV